MSGGAIRDFVNHKKLPKFENKLEIIISVMAYEHFFNSYFCEKLCRDSNVNFLYLKKKLEKDQIKIMDNLFHFFFTSTQWLLYSNLT